MLRASFTKRYPGSANVHVEGLEVQGGMTVLFGPSGAGKSTVLRCLAGLETPEQGTIIFGGETWFSKAENRILPPEKRGVGFVPQDGALFPHLTVTENVIYGLPRATLTENRSRAVQVLERFGVGSLAQRMPGALSGGERQRVALARAVIRHPRLLLLDEPFSAVDEPTRKELRSRLRTWLAASAVPTILVTHDRTEALMLGDRLVVLAGGRIQQAGPLVEVFHRPANLAVARVTGTDTVIEGSVECVETSLVTVRVGDARLVSVTEDFPETSIQAYVCIRAEDVVLTGEHLPSASARNRLLGVVVDVQLQGPLARVEVDCGFLLTALLTTQSAQELRLTPRAAVGVLIKAPHVHLIPRI